MQFESNADFGLSLPCLCECGITNVKRTSLTSTIVEKGLPIFSAVSGSCICCYPYSIVWAAAGIAGRLPFVRGPSRRLPKEHVKHRKFENRWSCELLSRIINLLIARRLKGARGQPSARSGPDAPHSREFQIARYSGSRLAGSHKTNTAQSATLANGEDYS